MMMNETLYNGLPEIDNGPVPPESAPIGEYAVQGIPLVIEAVLGRSRLTVAQLSKLHRDDHIDLDTNFGDPVDLKVNGTVIGRGEIVFNESKTAIGVKIVEISHGRRR
ncbi:FliM/FliN family flagellar motor switch protein [Ensifer adhaerens]|uniref:FliM/FliN family flagellar motor switch protein n=1 Tax=Ensifer adhaerens TaxID=106592 RepID=UPI00069E7985|nr:FliM/FliN family flagellar motor switch protein [Ensifer adhaerens]